jgi:hypothetical protein
MKNTESCITPEGSRRWDDARLANRSGAVLLQKLLNLDCGHATGSRSGNGLAVAPVLHIATGEDAVNAG